MRASAVFYIAIIFIADGNSSFSLFCGSGMGNQKKMCIFAREIEE